MNKTSIIVAVVVAVLVLGGLGYWYFAGSSSSNYSPAVYQPTSPESAATSPSNPSQQTNTPTASTTATVTYTGSGFSPSTITIPQGDTVVFQNSGSHDVWVASDPHPLHNGYPTTGGCIGSTFDSCGKVAPGSSWSFTFTYVGSWGYHNHANPSERGTVVVQ